MKPAHFLLMVPLALAGFVLAETRPPLELEAATQLEADLPLIEALVDGAIQIAREDNADLRAGHCQKLARRFVEEIQAAAAGKNHPRVTELSEHLKALMTRGMADNLGRVSLDSPRYKELESFKQNFIQPVETQLQKITAEDASMRQALEAVQHGRSEIDKAVKGKQPRSKGPANGKGKKGKKS